MSRTAVSAAESLRASFRLLATEGGSSVPLDAQHEAFLKPGKDGLIVSFETADALEDSQSGSLPISWQLARNTGWGSICVISDGPTWFRTPKMFEFFDRLTDVGTFDRYDRVVFYGAGPAGYAAAAFSLAAPGADVLALAPQATLSRHLAGWDTRFLRSRRIDFEGRYGYAPDMLEAAGRAVILFDPEVTEDAMHAALFHAPQTRLFPCRGLGSDLASHLRQMGVLEALLRAMMAGAPVEPLFWHLWRARRRHAPYLQALVRQLLDAGRPGAAAAVCRHGWRETERPWFAKRLAALDAQHRPPPRVSGAAGP